MATVTGKRPSQDVDELSPPGCTQGAACCHALSHSPRYWSYIQVTEAEAVTLIPSLTTQLCRFPACPHKPTLQCNYSELHSAGNVGKLKRTIIHGDALATRRLKQLLLLLFFGPYYSSNKMTKLVKVKRRPIWTYNTNKKHKFNMFWGCTRYSLPKPLALIVSLSPVTLDNNVNG